jgi:hypothetical protein
MIDHDLFQVAEAKYLRAEALSPDEVSCMEAALASTAPRVRCIACGALLRDSGPGPEQKASARRLLRSLCAETSDDDILTRTEVSVALLVLPDEELDNPAVRTFVYRLIESNFFTHRANAVLLLGRLARHTDANAARLLQLAARDAHPVVQTNARIAIRELGL